MNHLPPVPVGEFDRASGWATAMLVRAIVNDDALACTHQSIGQYRTTLLAKLDGFIEKCGSTTEPVAQAGAVFAGLHIDGTPRYERVPAQPRAVPPDEVARVAQHIAGAVEFIEKAYPDATHLDCRPILRTMRRWRDRLLAAAPSPPVPDGWVLAPLELTPEMAASAAIAAWPVATTDDRDKAASAALIMLKKAMSPLPGATADSIAASIATMFPAYRAMLAAAPAPGEPT